MSDAEILSELRDGVLTLTFNRPRVRNALNGAVIQGLLDGLDRAASDDGVRVVVLAANGPVFCAGADLQWMLELGQAADGSNENDAMILGRVFRTIYACPRPTLAVVQGPALGGGVGIVACCDIVIAAASAHFTFSEVRLGLIPSVISPFCVAALGPRVAKKLFMTGEKFDAHAAREWGLVHEVVAADGLSAARDVICENILNGGPRAVAAAKQLVHYVTGQPIDDALLFETARRIAGMRQSSEAQEGMAAFLEKRKAAWRGGGDAK